MLNIGAGELLVIGLVALIVVGPEQLPGLIRRVGQVVGQVRSVTDGLKKDFMDTMDDSGDFKKAVNPKSWTSGTGTKDDPVVPRGLADVKKKKKEEDTVASSSGSSVSGAEGETVASPGGPDASSSDAEGEL